ncbi:MAG: hypothetical protein Tsb005_03540 [Gammaproteobacteria bacterium]
MGIEQTNFNLNPSTLESIGADSFEMLLELPLPYLLLDEKNNICRYNRALINLFVIEQAPLSGKSISQLFPLYLHQQLQEKLKWVKCEKPVYWETKGLRSDGTEITISMHLFCLSQNALLKNCFIIDDSKNKELEDKLLVVEQMNQYHKQLKQAVVERSKKLEDASIELLQAKEQLYQEKERMQVTLESIADGVIATDVDGYVQYLNPVAQQLTGFNEEKACGQYIQVIFPTLIKDENNDISGLIKNSLVASKGTELTTVLPRKDGSDLIIQYSISPIRNRHEEIVGTVIVFHDITESQKLLKQVCYLASHDTLTNLINRNEFESQLKLLINEIIHHDAIIEHTLLYIDLDQFKVVNDTCGHSAGDELLRQVAEILDDTIPKSALIARIGGDEFAVILRECSHQEAYVVADNILLKLTKLPFYWGEKSFRIGASIGMVQINQGCGNFNRLMSWVDSACYAAKENGRNRIYVYGQDDKALAKRHGEMVWVAKINRGIDEGMFCLAYQTIAEVKNYKEKDYQEVNRSYIEMLIRLREDDGTVCSPGEFLPAAERYNLSPQLDRWVFTNTVKWLRKNTKLLQEMTMCALNISALSLNDKGFMDFLVGVLKEDKFLARKLCFEITETSAITNMANANRFIETVKQHGCWFALDDFGSGMSSFRYLKDMKVDYLKIDGEFVRHIVEDNVCFSFVRAIDEIGKAMQMKTVAEYVENEKIIECLQKIGVDYMQGYAVARPVLLEKDQHTGQFL